MLTASSMKVLDTIAVFVQRHPTWQIIVEYDKDSFVKSEKAQKKGGKKTQAIVDYLSNVKRIDRKRLIGASPIFIHRTKEQPSSTVTMVFRLYSSKFTP